ncbi:hypothetical protein BC629DRAFT_1592851 [Irpex lacteus]|nr:hypothetical protein BC629DRAFT_1592851 [Irpex lacteus]
MAAMPVDVPFDFEWDKMKTAMQYLSRSCEWLSASEGSLSSISGKLSIDTVEKTTKDFRNMLQNFALVDTSRPADVLEAGQSEQYLSYPWIRIQSVCRYWRQTAMHTPALWSYIRIWKIPYWVYQNTRYHASNVISRSIRLSGAVPLVVDIGEAIEGDHLEKTLMTELGSQTSRIRELRVEQPYHLAYFSTQAEALEVLAVYASFHSENRALGPFDGWQVPRLRTLSLHGYLGWCGATFGNLRHLIMINQSFDSDALLGLHALLSSNRRLEDLVFRDTEVRTPDGWATFDALTPIAMPSLKRVSIKHPHLEWREDDNRCVAGELIEKKLGLSAGTARDHHRLRPARFASIFPNPKRCVFPVKRLYLGSHHHLVGTDGHSSFRVLNTDIRLFLQRMVLASHQPEIRELWLWSGQNPVVDDWTGTRDSAWTDMLKAMTHVKKLVLVRDISFWLNCITEHRLFSSLEELQLHAQRFSDEPSIFLFLQDRNRRRIRRFKTLRIVLDDCVDADPERYVWNDSDSIDSFEDKPYDRKVQSEAFASWKANVDRRFGQLVPSVMFEESPCNGCAPRMELPAVCKVTSTVHPFWYSWSVE